jgi:hypothetical protein
MSEPLCLIIGGAIRLFSSHGRFKSLYFFGLDTDDMEVFANGTGSGHGATPARNDQICGSQLKLRVSTSSPLVAYVRTDPIQYFEQPIIDRVFVDQHG